MVKLHTTLGTITLELDESKAPDTVRNFLDYVNSGFYDGTIFHRVIDGFMIQGGGFEPGMQQKPARAPIRNEADNGLQNRAYTRRHGAHARPALRVQSVLHQRGRQRFPGLQRAHAAGLGLLRVRARGRRQGSGGPDQAACQTGSRGTHDDVPLEDVVIRKAEVV